MTKPEKPKRPKPAATAKLPAPPLREPTAMERRAMAAAVERQAERLARPELKVSQTGGTLTLDPVHNDQAGMQAHLDDAFGTVSRDFTDMILMRVSNAIAQDPAAVSQTELNAALALIAGMEPRTELEAAIAGQVVACDALAMEFVRRARRSETLQKADAYTNMATKASRTMVAHIDALSRLRTGGKQQVVVKHVYIQGNAVVADGAQVMQYGGDGGDGRNLRQAQTICGADALGPEVWGENPLREAVPVPSSEGAPQMQAARVRPRIGSAERD